jgi:acyl-coenzyme A thioesterase PaaI-like protein
MVEKKSLDSLSKQNTITDTSNRVHPNCFVCGRESYKGLKLDFSAKDDSNITATFLLDGAFEGYPGMLHGGILSSILDGAMGHCIFAKGQTPVTVEITTRFRHPVIVNEQAVVSARITETSYPLYILKAEIVQNGQIKATAKGKYFDQPQLANLIQEGLRR